MFFFTLHYVLFGVAGAYPSYLREKAECTLNIERSHTDTFIHVLNLLNPLLSMILDCLKKSHASRCQVHAKGSQPCFQPGPAYCEVRPLTTAPQCSPYLVLMQYIVFWGRSWRAWREPVHGENIQTSHSKEYICLSMYFYSLL